jgi:hypothetical protein
MSRKLLFSLPIAAMLAGFINALLAGGVHSTFFILLPVMAFIFGYFSSWRWGLLYGFLLFAGYTFATALMWEVGYALVGISQYIGAFILGGFSILLIGALAPMVRRGIKKAGAIIVLLILVGVVAGCIYISVPRYRHSYGLNILCTQNMELLLPVAIASDDLSAELLKRSATLTGSNPPDWYGIELIDTEYGQMWKLNMYGRISDTPTPGQIGISSNWYRNSDEILSWPGRSPTKMIQLTPKFDIRVINTIEPETIAWPSFITASRILEEFNVPLKVQTDNSTGFEMNLYCSVERISGINFGYQKSESYVEYINWYEGSTGDDWIMVPVEAIDAVSIRGLGD